jgi:hypothetical protein
VGVIYFLDENYGEVGSHLQTVQQKNAKAIKAEEHLAYAWKLCHRNATKNKQFVLTFSFLTELSLLTLPEG